MPLHIVRQDVSKIKVDAIVKMRKRYGKSQEGSLPLCTAKMAKRFSFKSEYVINASCSADVDGENVALKACYVESMKLAVDNNLDSVAFPLISFDDDYPKERLLSFAVQAISEFLLENEIQVYLCVSNYAKSEFGKTRLEEIRAAINDDYAICDANEDLYAPFCAAPSSEPMMMHEVVSEEKSNVLKSALKCRSAKCNSLEDYLKSMDKSFALRLFDLIDEKGMTDVECYKKANVDRKTFSKIRSNPNTYRPSKQTAVAFAIALKLNLEETQALLATAGLTLSKSFTFDRIIQYFIQNEVYDIYEINQALFEFDQVCLGC